eukprot:g4446.t1
MKSTNILTALAYCLYLCIFVFTSTIATSLSAAVPLPVNDLRVEYVPVPVFGVSVRKPRFSWALPSGEGVKRGVYQTAYRIILENEQMNLIIWDSGIVKSNNTLHIKTPNDLNSDTSYKFYVIWYNNINNIASPKATGYFTTALMEESDWGNSTWITLPGNNDTRNQFRTGLFIPNDTVVNRGTCFISGLGYHRSWFNGQRLGDVKNTLGHFAQFQRRIPYDTYDISNLIKPGKNILSILLGRGWYALPQDNFTRVLGYKTIGRRSLKVFCSVYLQNGKKLKFSSGNGLWRFSDGELVFDHLFLGPTIDKRKETAGWNTNNDYDDSNWDIVDNSMFDENRDPLGKLTSFIIPSAGKHDGRNPVAIKKLSNGINKGDVQFVLDFQVNQAMQCTLKYDSDGTDGGLTLRLHHAEQVDEKGDIIISNDLGGVQDKTTFILNNFSGIQVFETKFAYFGARYVKLSGWPENKKDPTPDIMTCYFVHTNLIGKSSIKFHSPKTSDSATILNGIHEITLRSALSNFMSTPTDCPSREKRGWTGDGQSAAETLIYSFDMSYVYSKWLVDIVDAQQCNYLVKPQSRNCPTNDPFCRVQGDRSDIPEMAPFLFGNVLNGCAEGSDPAWGSGYIALVDWVYRYYGDVQTLKFHYSAGKAYLDYLLQYVNTTSSSNSFLLDLSYPTTRYGDWCAPLPLNNNQCKHTSNLINGFFWLKQLRIMANAAKILGFVNDEKKWSDLAKRGAVSYNSLYFSEKKGMYEDIECTKDDDPSSHLADNNINMKTLEKPPCHNSSINANGELSVQTAQALPLFLQLPVSEKDKIRVGNALVEDVLHGPYPGRTTTGLVGTKYVLSELVKTGHADVALKIATSMQYPSWGRMLPRSVHPLGQGEGTLWEQWRGDKHTGFGSRNHIMLGGFDGPFFYGNLAGIQNNGQDGSLAWSNIIIAPTVAGDLSGVDAVVDTVRGNIKVNWKINGTNSFFINVTIPTGCKAKVKLPLLNDKTTANDVNVLESGTIVWKSGGVGYKPGVVSGIDKVKADSNLAGNFISLDIQS